MPDFASALPIPFHIAVEPLERLLLVNFENDPDDVYKGFEPQVFDDEKHGCGHLVIGWRIDGRVDVYHERSVRPDPATFGITGGGLAAMIPTDFESARFSIEDQGADAKYAFKDQLRRPVIIRIKETSPKRRKPFGLLAPMGAAAEHPQALPLVYLLDFYFVRKHGTRVNVSIDGRSHHIDRLPFPMDFAWMYFARYSPQPLIALLNPAFEGPLPQADLTKAGTAAISWRGHDISLDWTEGTPGIASMSCADGVHPVSLRFDPPFPHLLSIPEAGTALGSFEIGSHPSTGLVGGGYRVQRAGGLITLTMTPSLGWMPRPSKWSLRLLYAVAGIFKNWPKTYRWDAQIQIQKSGLGTMASAWTREEP